VEDERLGLVPRLQLAIGALQLVELFDTFPVGNVIETPATHACRSQQLRLCLAGDKPIAGGVDSLKVIFMESNGKSFGSTGNYTIKVCFGFFFSLLLLAHTFVDS
jgi:hypothetical protein